MKDLASSLVSGHGPIAAVCSSTRRAVACVMVGALLLVHAHAPLAQEATGFALRDGPEAGRTGADALQLYVSPDVPQDTLERMALELDGIDITALVSWAGDDLVYAPAQPLAPGAHVLRLVEASGEALVERSRWRFDVVGGVAQRQTDASIAGELAFSRRVADDSLSAAPGRLQSSGHTDLHAEVKDPAWSAGGDAVLLHDSTGQSLDGHIVELGDYLVQAKRGAVQAYIGHHAPAPASLVVGSGFSRRGASLHYGVDAVEGAIDAFVTRATPVFGVRHGFGVGDAENRVMGLSVSGVAFNLGEHRLALGSSFVDGRSDEAGASVLTESTGQGGHALGASALLSLFSERVVVGGEFAVSEYDFDEGFGFGAEGDNAADIFGELRSASGAELSWRAGTRYTRLGTFYRSIANPSGGSDLERISGYGDVAMGGWSVDAAVSFARDNLEGSPLLARTEVDAYHAGLSYSPADAPAWMVQSLGQPSFALSLDRERVGTDSVPAGVTATRADSSTLVAGVAASFSHTRFDWSVDYTITDVDDHTGANIDARTHSTGIQASFRALDDRLTLSPGLRLDYVVERDAGALAENWLGGLGASYDILPGRLSSEASVQLARGWRSDGSVDNYVVTAAAGLSWTVIPVSANQPGLVASFEGSLQDNIDKAAPGSSLGQYQAFVKLRMVLPEGR